MAALWRAIGKLMHLGKKRKGKRMLEFAKHILREIFNNFVSHNGKLSIS